MLKYIATISMLCLGLTLATPAAAQNCDNRGSNWQGRIDLPSGIYGFELRRLTCAADSMWNYYIWNTTSRWEGTATVGMAGTALSVNTVSGSLAGCSLSGTWYPRDVTNGIPYRGSGSAFCSGSGTWSANIR
ncbi:hypothetical protein [Alterinioella nitratireducens]|uniref:hypothetical protein n=1 Tax=Alterinioella nitratireducens TaxID=2735915 RepID=UPI001553774E|nr:hypothetical protein [Alterinioella nitratireducens]NPD18424.1 hypothetical protein [Alterinioella nitratireducens]|tara:strand:- start:407 stop:802 length:396 start_codon:yes stop_codon:yes gene_type:complete